jgi:hypothetical protein
MMFKKEDVKPIPFSPNCFIGEDGSVVRIEPEKVSHLPMIEFSGSGFSFEDAVKDLNKSIINSCNGFSSAYVFCSPMNVFNPSFIEGVVDPRGKSIEDSKKYKATMFAVVVGTKEG